MRKKYFLPIGTVIKLKHVKNKIIITGYCMKTKTKIYDYCGIVYPIGFIGQPLCFDINDITAILKVGYIDSECKELLTNVMKISEKLKEV